MIITPESCSLYTCGNKNKETILSKIFKQSYIKKLLCFFSKNSVFTKTNDYASIKITGPLIDAVEKHVFDSWDDVTVTVEKIIPDNYTIEVQLEQKDSDGNTYTFDLDDCEPDSYRIVVFALRTSDRFVSAQAPYYFIVE